MSPHFLKRHGVIFTILWQVLICFFITMAVIIFLYLCQARDKETIGIVAYLAVILFYYFSIRKRQSFEPIGHCSWKSFLIIYGFSVVYLGIYALICLPVQTITPLPYVAYVGLISFIFVGWAEELIFREYFMGKMMQHGYKPWTAILVSAFFFSIAHSPENLYDIIPSLPLGILFGWLYIKTKDLGIPIALHCCWNMIAWLLKRSEIWESTDIENAAPVITAAFPQSLSYEYYVIYALLGWLIFIVAIFLIAKKIGGRYVAQCIK